MKKPHSIETAYDGDLRTSAVHLKSATSIITDAPTDNNGKGEAFSPTDLVCAALSSCMMTIMGIYARKEGIDISGMTSEIIKTMTSSPRRISKIEIHFFHPGIEAYEGQLKTMKELALNCPVALSLSPEVEQHVVFDF